MWFYLSSVFFAISIRILNCEETTTTKPTIITSNTTLIVNKTNEFNSNNITMERIIQPVSYQTQQIDRKVLKPHNLSLTNRTEKIEEEFRPSPHLETYYEFNKFPVIPALPESKHRTATTSNFGEKSYLKDLTNTSTEGPWYSKIKFPSTVNQDRPSYHHQFSATLNEKSQGKSFGNFFDTKNKRPLNFHPSLPVDNKFQFNAPVISGNNWDKFEKDNQGNGFKAGRPGVNPQLDYGLLPDKSYDYNPHKTSYDNHNSPDKHPANSSLNPWKKIIKFLTAFIPIGLLISALTPTVITVTSVNDTQSRLRFDDRINYFHKLSLDGCEDRIMCELLLSATESKDSEKHLNNLLDTFTENHEKIVEQADRMTKIFEAVKNQDCSNIICSKIKDSR